jgi:hypothetical protein
MPVYLEGALIGLAVAVFLVAAEYLLIKKAAKERAARFHRKVEIDSSEHNRIRSIATFSMFLPFAFALGWWILWG